MAAIRGGGVAAVYVYHYTVCIQSPVVARTLTLISKSVQSLVNIGGPKVCTPLVCVYELLIYIDHTHLQMTGSLQHKESYMNKLNLELQDQTKNVMDYLTAISDPLGGVENDHDQVVCREG